MPDEMIDTDSIAVRQLELEQFTRKLGIETFQHKIDPVMPDCFLMTIVQRLKQLTVLQMYHLISNDTCRCWLSIDSICVPCSASGELRLYALGALTQLSHTQFI